MFHYYIDNVANAANPSLLPVEPEFETKILHRGFIVTGVIQCEIAELIVNLKLLDNLDNLPCNVLACVPLCKLRQAENTLLWPVVGIPEHACDAI